MKFTEKLDFSDNALGVDQVLEGLGHLFYRDLHLVLPVVGRADNAVSAVPDLLNIFKFVVDDESGS